MLIIICLWFRIKLLEYHTWIQKVLYQYKWRLDDSMDEWNDGDFANSGNKVFEIWRVENICLNY